MFENLTEQDLLEKSSEELTSLLYQGLINKLEKAIDAIRDKDYMVANKFLQQSNDILHRLGAGIKYEAGLIADQLDNLYSYMREQLIIGNAKKDIKTLQTVLKIADDLAEAWQQAIDNGVDKQQVNKKVQAYDRAFMSMNTY